MSLRLCRCALSSMALIVLLAGWKESGAQGVLSPREFHQRVARSKALPDDPLAAVHRLLSLPPVTSTVAPFRGNQTAILASPQNAFAMVRETDCSLTAFNAMYSLSTSASSFNYASRTFHFDQQLHSSAGLTTVGGTFPNGCKDPGNGVLSNSLIYAGMTPSQLRVGALAGYNSQSGHNQLFTIVSKEDGTLVGITTQPDPTGVGANSYPYSVVAGDLNKDGIADLVTVNYALAGASSFSTITVFLGKTDGTFAAGVSYAVSSTIVQTLVLDDFDGDGKLDVVVPSATSTGGSEVTFFPGKGDGTLGTVKTTALTGTGSVIGSLGDGSISGDFNGDGKKDLISALGVVLLGKGDGTFTQASTRAFTGLSANSIIGPQLVAGDFNKDGKLDLAAGTGDSISIYFGNGDGTFTPGGGYASIDNVGYLTATDLDGDGNLDLYSGSATNGIFGGDNFTPSAGYALMGKGDGTFLGAPQTTASAITQLEDLNGDGKLDYISLDQNSQGGSSFDVYLGNGDGSFRAAAPVTMTPFTYSNMTYTVGAFDSYALADVDGDGHVDIIALPSQYFNGNPKRFGFLIALGKSDGMFQAPTFVPFPSLIPGGGQDYVYGVQGLFAAKRADGKDEIVYSFLTQDFNNSFLYYEGFATQAVTGDGTLGAPATTDTYSGTQPPNANQTVDISVSRLADLNGDRTPDIVQYVPAVFGGGGVVTTPQRFQAYLGKTDGTFDPAATVVVVDNPLGPISAVDVNGDGKLDLIAEGNTGDNGKGEIGVALGKGDGTFQVPKTFTLMTLPTDKPSMAIADFDGDGKVDLAVLGFQPPYDSGVFPGNGDGTFQGVASGANDGSVAPPQPIELATASTSQTLLAADIDGDGKIDIVGPTVLINQYGVVTPPTKTNTTTALAASSTNIVAGATVTLTATVTGSGATGSVSFADGATTLGSSPLNASGVATLAVSTLSAGTHAIVATYGGDASFNSSVSNAVTVTVAQPTVADFSVSLSPASATLASGGTTSSTVTITPAGGFSSAVTLNCSGLPQNAVCAFSTGSVTPSNSGATSIVTIKTGVSTAAQLERTGGISFAGLGLLGLISLGFRSTRRATQRMCLVLAIGMIAGMAGCGSSHPSNGGIKTPAGTYTVSVTGTSGETTHSSSFTLTVQ